MTLAVTRRGYLVEIDDGERPVQAKAASALEAGRVPRVSDFVWFRQAMPWLGPGFVYCVHEDALDTLRGDLARHRFNIVSLDGTAMTDGPSFHAEAKRAFGFPDYYGSNWDAFNECLGEIRLAHPTAIL